MSIAKVRDMIMSFEIQGRGEALMLISDLGTNRTFWANQLPAFSSTMMTITFDGRGTGNTESPEGKTSIETLAQDAIGLMGVIGLEKTHLIGMGMGGRVAAKVALNKPNSVQTLVLCSTSPCATPSQMTFLRSIQLLSRSGASPKEIACFELPWLQSRRFVSDKRMIKALATLRANRFSGTSPESRCQLIDAYLENDLSDQMQEISMPTLIVSGQDDILTPICYQEEMAKKIRGAEILRLEAAHMVNSERPREFNYGVLDFIQRHS